MDWQKNRYFVEKMSGIFVILLLSISIVFNINFGFNLGLYLAMIIGSLLIVVAYPVAGMYAAVFLTCVFERFFTQQSIFLNHAEYKLYPLDILMLAMVLGIFLKTIVERKKVDRRIFDTSAALFFVVIGVYSLASILLLGGDASLSFSGFKNYVFYAGFIFLVPLILENQKRLESLLQFALASMVAIIGFLIYGTISGTGLWSEYTPLSTNGSRLLAFTHGYYLALGVIFASAYLAVKNAKNPLLFLVPIWLFGVTGSLMRHLWIGIFVGFLTVLFLLSRQEKIRLARIGIKYAATLMVGLIVFVYLVLLFPYSESGREVENAAGVAWERLVSIGNTRDVSIAWRGVVWEQALKEYGKSPLLGIGFGKKVFIEIEDYADYVEIRSVHNSFLAILIQSGILGIVTFLAMLFSLAKKALRKIQNSEYLHFVKIASLSVLVFHLTVFVFQPYLESNILSVFFWMNLGVLNFLWLQSEEKTFDKKENIV